MAAVFDCRSQIEREKGRCGCVSLLVKKGDKTILYYYNKKEVNEFGNDFHYFSDGCGNLKNNFKYIEEPDLPERLRHAYKHLWTDGTGSYCYPCRPSLSAFDYDIQWNGIGNGKE